MRADFSDGCCLPDDPLIAFLKTSVTAFLIAAPECLLHCMQIASLIAFPECMRIASLIWFVLSEETSDDL